jgi:Tfp pilus assembly protein PilN
MKTRLNLYTEAFRPAPLRLGRLAMLAAIGFLVFVISAQGAWLQWRNRDLTAQHQSLQAEAEQLETRMLALSKRVDERTEDQALLLAIERESRTVNGKRQLIAHLGNGPLLVENRFSILMQALSENHLEGLWLTRVRAEGQHLILDGRSLSEELVPRWIRRLSQQKGFHGKQFGLLELRQPEQTRNNGLMFHLSTRLKESGNG